MSVDPILPESLGVAFFTIAFGWVVENVYKTEYTKIG